MLKEAAGPSFLCSRSPPMLRLFRPLKRQRLRKEEPPLPSQTITSNYFYCFLASGQARCAVLLGTHLSYFLPARTLVFTVPCSATMPRGSFRFKEAFHKLACFSESPSTAGRTARGCSFSGYASSPCPRFDVKCPLCLTSGLSVCLHLQWRGE